MEGGIHGGGPGRPRLGSGKPYDEGSEVEATLAIPAWSHEQQRDKGGEEERIMMRVSEQDPSVSS